MQGVGHQLHQILNLLLLHHPVSPSTRVCLEYGKGGTRSASDSCSPAAG
jgi:hypothetical protein